MSTIDLILKAVGAPPPEREYIFAPPRKWRFDFAWPEEQIALEIEGGIWTRGRHVRGRGYEQDCEKYNRATLLGWKVYRITTGMLHDGRALHLLLGIFRREKIPPLSPSENTQKISHHN